jgi:hypothetical protein
MGSKARVCVLFVGIAVLLPGCGDVNKPPPNNNAPADPTADEKFAQKEPWFETTDHSEHLSSRRSDLRISFSHDCISFSIPQDWVDWNSEFHDNFFFTREELARAAKGSGYQHRGFASICNDVFPYDRCAVHVGSGSWANHSGSYGELQVRVYDIRGDVDSIKKRIAERVPAEVRRVGGRGVTVSSVEAPPWCRISYSYPHTEEYDVTEISVVTFCLRPVRGRVLVVVLMHTEPNMHVRTIDDLLNSFVVDK